MAQNPLLNGLPKWEKGGPNDPTVAFYGLNSALFLCKDHLTPWAWRAYADDFRSRQKAEKKLTALNNLPGSGAEPKDGIIQGTPLWQERLDTMLLIEHLKEKVMAAHTEFSEAITWLLKCHAWLVKDSLLADEFVDCITHIPPSKHDMIDALQRALAASRKECDDLRAEFDDFKVDLATKREIYLQKTVDNQVNTIRRKYFDDTVVGWSFETQRAQTARHREARRVLEARVLDLETAFVARTEELLETTRQFEEEKRLLEEDRDMWKKKYNKMLKAHEQAMEDLKEAGDSVEKQAQMIQVLSIEKSRLTDEVEQLKEDKRRMAKQLDELRQELSAIKKEFRILGQQMRDLESVLYAERDESFRLGFVREELEMRLNHSGRLEATLRTQLMASRKEAKAKSRQNEEYREQLSAAGRTRTSLETERDMVLQTVRDLELELKETVLDWRKKFKDAKEKAKADLEHFKTSELGRVLDDFKRRTDALQRRNAHLEREVAMGDALGAHLAVLNPLSVDDSVVCQSCRKAMVFEGSVKAFEPPSRPNKGGAGGGDAGGYPPQPSEPPPQPAQ